MVNLGEGGLGEKGVSLQMHWEGEIILLTHEDAEPQETCFHWDSVHLILH